MKPLLRRLIHETDGAWSVATVYRNTPKVQVRPRSEIHHGAMWLRLQDDPEASLEGHYWTDRNTRGDIRLSNRRSKLVFSYDAAATT